MTAQGVNENVLDGLAFGGIVAHSAAALSLAQVSPVGGSIGGSGKTGRVDEGFKEKRPVTVQPFPILRKAVGGKRKGFTGKPLDGDPGQHQESALIDDKLKVGFPLFRIPSDPGIARRHHPGISA